MFRALLIIFLVVYIQIAFSQIIDPQLVDSVNTQNYYETLPDYLTARFLIFENFSDFNLNDNLRNESISYLSSPWPSVGIGGSYRWLGFSLSGGLNDPSDTLYGEKHRIDFQTSFYLRKVTINLFSGIYSGYYIENPKLLISNWDTKKYYTRSDIQTATLGVNAYYVYNSDKYSNKAIYSQTEWQKKSAGSLILGGTVLFNQVEADSALVPEQFRVDSFFNESHFYRYKHAHAGSEVGYAFTLVLMKHLFFNFSIMGGLGFGKTTMYFTDAAPSSVVRLNITLLNSAGLGYNGKRFFAGFSYTNIITHTPSPVENTSMGHTTGRFQIVTAYRFKIPEHKNPLPAWLPLTL